MSTTTFAARVIAWARDHGRHDLPWQRARTAYRVWLSEIMLQQTQVQTVIPYFERFTTRFPDVASLAAAAEDEVLHLWSGLGYYSRARNLLATARQVMVAHGGEFPRDQAALAALPGIGRSTAAAILALAHDLPAPILDGNVKRVLARYHAEPGWPGDGAVLKRLWAHAERHQPATRARAYTQAMMDLGATLCTRTRPACPRCPLASACAACQAGTQALYPRRAPAHAARTAYPLPGPARRWARSCSNGARRAGVGRLVVLPGNGSGWRNRRRTGPPARRHAPRHAPARAAGAHLHPFPTRIEPVLIELPTRPGEVAEDAGRCWYSPGDSTRIGLSAPVTRLLATLETLRREA